MKTKLGLLLLMLLIAVGCDDSTQSKQATEIAKLQKQVENLQKLAAEKAALDLGNNPAEQKIIDELDNETRMSFVDAPLKDVIDTIKSLHNIPIVIDERALTEVGLDSNSLYITIDLQGISLRSGLKLMLSNVNLTYVINDEMLKITTPEAAENEAF